jgi:hypothetical protein
MNVWSLSLNGELKAVFDTEEKALEARRRWLASGLEDGRLTVLAVGQWELR